ncbi:MAG: hypothetical protein Q9188_004287 [Gyalolechia gomerana]
MALIAVAEDAQDIAACFNKFLDPVPEISVQITRVISECYAISSALRELDSATQNPRYAYDYAYVARDITTVCQSLHYTFSDVSDLFRGLGRPLSHVSNWTLYKQVWREIDDHFYRESNTSLHKRLEHNRLYIDEIFCSLIDGQRSFERRRPPGLLTHAPEPPPALPGGARRPPPMSPQSPPGFDQDYPWAPPAPEVPHSPTATTATFSTQSSAADSSLDHWLPAVFAQSRPTTPFHRTGETSNVYGVNMPGASERLAREYDKILDLPIEDGNVRILPKLTTTSQIIDDNFEHALRVFRDRDSGGIRLQASVLGGELKRTPVWTAFITTHIQSRQWKKEAASKIVHIADLQRYVFTNEYKPQLGPQGEHELRFIYSGDAREFMARIDDLAGN